MKHNELIKKLTLNCLESKLEEFKHDVVIIWDDVKPELQEIALGEKSHFNRWTFINSRIEYRVPKSYFSKIKDIYYDSVKERHTMNTYTTYVDMNNTNKPNFNINTTFTLFGETYPTPIDKETAISLWMKLIQHKKTIHDELEEVNDALVDMSRNSKMARVLSDQLNECDTALTFIIDNMTE